MTSRRTSRVLLDIGDVESHQTLEVVLEQHVGPGLFFQSDHIVDLDAVGGDIHLPAVHQDMPNATSLDDPKTRIDHLTKNNLQHLR